MTKSVDVQKFESNGEVFEIGSYHGISILIRRSDGYINATKLCDQFEKRFRNVIRNDIWRESFDEFEEHLGVRSKLSEPKNIEFQENSGTVGKTTVLILDVPSNCNFSLLFFFPYK